MIRPTLRPVVAVLATGAVALAAGFLPVRQPVAAPVAVATTRTLGCPVGDPATLQTTLMAASSESIRTKQLGDTSIGEAQRYLKAPAQKPMIVTGGATLGALSSSVVAAGPYHGLWLAPCREPASEHWFSGVVSTATEQAALELVNGDPTQAVVDVTILGKDGRVTAAGARGLTVSANSARVVYLEPLLTSADPVGIQVRTSEGRVSATVRMSGAAGGDWVAGLAAPSTSTVLPLVPGGEGARTLVISNPGNRRASVSVEVLDKASSFAPAGADTFDVNAESTVAIPLEGALRGAAVALRLTSTQPVTGSVRVVSGGDLAVVGSAGPLTAPIHVPAVAGAQLFIANAGTEVATVTLTTRSAEGGMIDTSKIELEGGRSMPLPLTGDRTASFELVASSRDVRGAMVVTTSGEVTGMSVAVLGGTAGRAAAIDPTLDPRLAR